MSVPLRIAVAGLGTVGSSTVHVLRTGAEMLAARAGRALALVAISSRDKTKARGCDISNLEWVDDPLELATRADVDVVVELIGGAEGVARTLVEKALANGKHVVTANKALIAHHGLALAKNAEQAQSMFAYEAAVAGGIPIIKGLREGLAANKFTHIAGILNGTCNFILTSMWDKKQDFSHALAAAQAAGFAEADPSFDIDGIDAAHKTAIITSLAYGCPPAIKSVYVEGIRSVSLRDMIFADELGYVIKLLGITSRTPEGILQRVHPCMVPKLSTIGRVSGGFNAIVVEGDPVGRISLQGPGAGGGPTASSVVGDIVDIARGATYRPFTLPVAALKILPFARIDSLHTSYYVRLAVVDKPGVLAAITSILRDEGISLRSFLQHSHTPGETVQVVLTTHETQELAMQQALESIARIDAIQEKPCLIRIESL